MTYMKAPPEEWTPYLSYALRPLRPVCLAGVNAETYIGEWKPPQVACMQWWKVPAFAFVRAHTASLGRRGARSAAAGERE